LSALGREARNEDDASASAEVHGPASGSSTFASVLRSTSAFGVMFELSSPWR